MNPVLPSAEEVVIGFLTDHPALVPLHVGRVGVDLGEALPAVRVTRVGGGPGNWSEDLPAVSIECWADDALQASLLARTAIAAIPDIVGDHVRGCEVVFGPLSRPDPDTDAQCHVFDVALAIYA